MHPYQRQPHQISVSHFILRSVHTFTIENTHYKKDRVHLKLDLIEYCVIWKTSINHNHSLYHSHKNEFSIYPLIESGPGETFLRTFSIDASTEYSLISMS